MITGGGRGCGDILTAMAAVSAAGGATFNAAQGFFKCIILPWVDTTVQLSLLICLRTMQCTCSLCLLQAVPTHVAKSS